MRKKSQYKKLLEKLPPDQRGDGDVVFTKEDKKKLQRLGPHKKWSTIQVLQRHLWGRSQ
jgi:hypothetical protein